MDNEIQFIRDSSYIFDGVAIVLGAIALIGGFAQLASGRLPYPDLLTRLRRRLPATADDVRLEGLVIVLRATAVVVFGSGVFMWHLLLGQRPDQTLQVVFWIAYLTVFSTGGLLIEVGRRAGKNRHYSRREPTSQRRTT
jgi:hypothetical protein